MKEYRDTFTPGAKRITGALVVSRARYCRSATQQHDSEQDHGNGKAVGACHLRDECAYDGTTAKGDAHCPEHIGPAKQLGIAPVGKGREQAFDGLAEIVGG